MIRLSIVIPAYNVEEYIAECIKGVLDQDVSPDEYEVIVVNDGSSDNTLEIVKKIASTHPNINIISQENKGVGVARNIGIDVACGKYIWFVDADDRIKSNVLGTLLKFAELNQTELLRFDFRNINNYSEIPHSKDESVKEEWISPKDFLQTKVRHKFFLFCHFFDREIIAGKQLRFSDLRMCEDVPFLGSYVTFTEKILCLNIEVYYHYNRPGSIVNTLSLKHAEDALTAYGELSEILSVYANDNRFSAYLKRLIMTQIVHIFRMSDRMDSQSKSALIDFFKKSKLHNFRIVLSKISVRKVLKCFQIKYNTGTLFR